MGEKGANKSGRKGGPGQGGGGSPVYGLGFVGAVVWHWQHANTPQEKALAVLKSMVWPAFLVYGAFRALDRSEVAV
ncbi:hypothetical protein ACI78T_17320 [Blastococcus sp. SYSU D00922]